MLVRFDAEPGSDTTRRLAGIASKLSGQSRIGITELIPAFTTLTVCFDPDRVDASTVTRMIEQAISDAAPAAFESAVHELPVRYGSEWGPDMSEVCERTGLSETDIVELHSSRLYTVYLLGFSPGFAYLGDVAPEIHLPRRANPRPAVPKGAVAIATSYTAVYPQATAGGWHLIGRTDASLFDVTRASPALLRPGDRVKFVPVRS